MPRMERLGICDSSLPVGERVTRLRVHGKEPPLVLILVIRVPTIFALFFASMLVTVGAEGLVREGAKSGWLLFAMSVEEMGLFLDRDRRAKRMRFCRRRGCCLAPASLPWRFDSW